MGPRTDMPPCCLPTSLLPLLLWKATQQSPHHSLNPSAHRKAPAAATIKSALLKLCKSLLELMSALTTKYFVSSVFKSCLSDGNVETGKKINISTTYLMLKHSNWNLALLDDAENI